MGAQHPLGFPPPLTVSISPLLLLERTRPGAHANTSTLALTGAQGLELIGQVAHLVSQAIANKENLEALRDRAAELMDILIEKHVVCVVHVCSCVFPKCGQVKSSV